ncbi:MAG TPA: arginase family protein [Longimicrobiales bacterium]|nr:arginase family protein [Longimicrobiales bacterium]
MGMRLIAVPYDSGRRGWRMGAGPEHLLGRGLERELVAAGHRVDVQVVETKATVDVEAAFHLAELIAAQVRSARSDDVLPVILAGNCISTLGALNGFDSKPALLWLDAHADFNTPETSPSGFLDGMALSIITGRCYRERLLPDNHIMMLGIRSIDEGEKAALESVHVIKSSRQLWTALASIDSPDLYLHIDLDSFDPSVLRANHFATDRGLTLHTVHDAIDAIRANKRVVGISFTAYDPEADAANQALPIVVDIINRISA